MRNLVAQVGRQHLTAATATGNVTTRSRSIHVTDVHNGIFVSHSWSERGNIRGNDRAQWTIIIYNGNIVINERAAKDRP